MASKTGSKFDESKPKWDLVPYDQLSKVVDVLTYGASKYGAHNWQEVPEAQTRYFAAAMRHLTAWQGGYETDEESGLPHLAHAACSLLFLLWSDANKEE